MVMGKLGDSSLKIILPKASVAPPNLSAKLSDTIAEPLCERASFGFPVRISVSKTSKNEVSATIMEPLIIFLSSSENLSLFQIGVILVAYSTPGIYSLKPGAIAPETL